MTSSAPNTLRLPAAAPPETSAAAPPRMPGLDWLRAGAALAVVALHAGIPYMTHPLPSLEWCVRAGERSAVVDALCWAINVAVMPTFFLMGGALAAGVWKRNPGKAFLVHRTWRLMVPLAFAVLVVLPADMYVWLIGWYTQGLIPWKKVLSIKLASPLSEQFWGVAHLWYLECLWTLSVVAAFIQFGRAKLLQDRVATSIYPRTRTTRTQLLIVVAAGFFLALDPTFLIGFQQAWWPGPAAIAFYGIFFAAGWVPASEGSRNDAKFRLLVAAGLLAVLLPQIHRHVEVPFAGVNLFVLTTAYATVSWMAATGFYGLAKSIRSGSVPRSVAFTAEASFWMYLVHHPLVGLTQLALLNSSLSPLAKFLLSLCTGIGLSLGSYAALVRSTWIGQLLNGQGLSRRQVQPATLPEAPAVAEPARRAA